MLNRRGFGAHLKSAICILFLFFVAPSLYAAEPATVPSKAELNARLWQDGRVAGGCSPAYQCCDYCWDGACPDEWRLDNDCDCGCQWEDPRCPSCDYCWAQGGCSPDYDGDNAGCDCGCDFFDTDCPALVECTSDANCNPDDACTDHYCNTDVNQCQSSPTNVCGDGTCETSCENCESCPSDCSCISCAESCISGSCVPACGDGTCSSGCDEDCDSCPSDCGQCGACCRPTRDVQVAGFDSCIVTSFHECSEFQGEFVGVGTTCDETTCAGACCTLYPFGVPLCLDGSGGFNGPITRDDCEINLQGTFAGIGTTCPSAENLVCPTGACCGPEGQCADILDEIGGKVPPGLGVTQQICELLGGSFRGAATTCDTNPCAVPTAQRLSTVKKGSLLIFPKVELRWDVAGTLTQDTIVTLVNDFTRDVHVKLYFINGDAPTAPIYADDLQTILVERGHNGWNQVDCVIELTENESTYLVMSNGVGGCQRFSILDPGSPPGRPNLEPDGGRVLRGFVIAFAVDENQNEISYNHLSGHADLIHYGIRSAWEYQSYAFQAINPSTGTWTDGTPGELSLDGLEYDYAFNTLLFDFYAVGSTALSNGGTTVMLDTDLTLHPVSVDLRQDSCGPITTKAHFDIWNANEDFRSGTTRCITCWDQTLLSAYSVGNGLDNNFILADLGTDKGKARIDGMASFECDNRFVPPNLDDAILQWLLLHDRTCDPSGEGAVAGRVNGECCLYTINDSQNAALLGVAAKVLSFSGGATGSTWAGMNLVGAGQEAAQIRFDIPTPPEPATNGGGRPGTANYQRSKLGEAKGK